MKRYLTVKDVMWQLQVSRGTVRNLVLRGELRPARIAPGRRRVRFDPEEVERYVRRSTRGTVP